MDKQFLMELLEVAVVSPNINKKTKNKANEEYKKLKKDRDSYELSKTQALSFVDEYNDKVVDDEAEVIFNDEEFVTLILFKNYDLDSNDIENKLEKKYLKDCSKNISFRYMPNVYYSSLY